MEAGPAQSMLTGRLNFARNGHSIDFRGLDIQMKLAFVVSLLVAASFAAYAQPAMPRMISVDPANGERGMWSPSR